MVLEIGNTFSYSPPVFIHREGYIKVCWGRREPRSEASYIHPRQATSCSLLETDAPQQVLKARVRAKRVEPWVNLEVDQQLSPLLVSLLEPGKYLFGIAQLQVT